MSDKPNVGLILNFDLLGTNLNAAYEKTGNKHKALLLPSDIEATKRVGLGEMVDSMKDALGIEVPKKDIEDSVNSADSGKDKKFDWQKITFELKAAYFYLCKEGDKADIDYAFAIRVDLADAIPDMGFLKINNVGLAIWNTTRTAVLNKMNMGSIDNLLKVLEAPK